MKNELIRVNDGVASLSAETASQIAEFQRVIKDFNEREKALKSQICAEMEEKGILWIDTEDLRISYVAPSDREVFDTKTFREENPLIYDEYVKMSHVRSHVRSSVRIKVKDNE